MVSLLRSPRLSSFLLSLPPPSSLLSRRILSLLLAVASRARASMYVFIDVTRDSRTQLTARKHRMHREDAPEILRLRLSENSASPEYRSRFPRDINSCLCILTRRLRPCNKTMYEQILSETMIERPGVLPCAIEDLVYTCERIIFAIPIAIEITAS